MPKGIAFDGKRHISNMIPESIENIQALVREHSHIHVHGARTKSALHPQIVIPSCEWPERPKRPAETGLSDRSAPSAPVAPEFLSSASEKSYPSIAQDSSLLLGMTDAIYDLDMRQLSGVLQYDAQEFVLTALAGTPVHEVEAILAAQGQYLPFDPLLVERGATLGGTVAANASGPGRFRYGGVRDFLIGTRFIDGSGQLIQGGGKVVKNAAGFDYPKLMVGSYGRLGVLVELTFKVFPRPQAYHTVLVTQPDLAHTLEALYKLTSAPLDIEALDIVPSDIDKGAGYVMQIRIGGLQTALLQRAERLRQTLGNGEILTEADDGAFWRAVRELSWAGEQPVCKVPITPARMAALEAILRPQHAIRRYSVGGNVAWLATANMPTGFDAQPFIGNYSSPPMTLHAFAQRIKQALDPEHRLV